MVHPEKFEFERARGLVWVCDLVGSSKYLNDDNAVELLEDFLPRLHWTASNIVNAAGGEFVKWTGDGFLAWFPTPLHRQLGERAGKVYQAAWHLTLLVNVTQLGVSPEQRLKVRHGVTYEHDALVTKITYPGGFEVLDLTGRAVVLAFRLSGVLVDFPSIVTQKELVEASAGYRVGGLNFKRWQLSADERLKYFKGERWGTSSLYRSGNRSYRERSLRTVARRVKGVIAQAQGEVSPTPDSIAFAHAFLDRMLAGPEWCRAVMDQYLRFLREDLLYTLENLVPVLEKLSEGRSS